MENPGVGEMARASSSTPIAAPSERKQFDPVRDAVAYTELEDATAGTHYPTAPKAYEAAGSTAVNHAAASQAPWDQGRVATQETHAMTSSYAHDPAAIPADSSNADGFPEHYDMSVDARHEQHPAATHGYGAQLPGDEDHDGPSMDTDQMSQATSAPSMELYVDSQGDADSAIGDFSIMSSTQSLRSSVYEFVEENGRRFHRFKRGEYHLPNDETEQDRLDLQHHLMLLTLDGKLHLAPVEEMEGGLHNVLDIATGTGIWAIDFASAFPAASVLGSDLSPIQPDFVPPNCRFEVDDVEDDWVYSHKFDYIHGRALALCFRSHKVVFEHAFNALRPGGWFEVQDVALPMVALDDTVAGTAMELWVSRLLAGGRALGKDFSRVPTYKKIFQELGFVDIVERHFQWPVGTWAKGEKMKVLGAWMREDMLSGIQGGSMGVMVKGLGMTVEEVERFLVDVRADIKSNRVHSYFPVHVVYGRKPF